MKLKSTLRSFLAIAGSSLLTITYVSAGTYYWDSDGDGITGFGSAIGTWRETPDATTNKWNTSPTGDTVGGAAVANYATTTSDDLFFGTGPTGATPPLYNYTGATTISGTVNAKSIYQSANHPNFSGSGATINFAAVGTYETAKANTAFAATTTISGAGTSLTWKVPFSSTLNISNITTNGAAQNILKGPGRLAINSMTPLGASAQPLVFDGGVLRFASGFPFATYPNATTFNTVHSITFNLNQDAGFDNQIGSSTFTVDVPLALGTGGFSVEGNNAATIALTNTGNNYSGATKLIGAILQISDAANIGTAAAPFYFNGTLKITGTGMTSLGSRPVVIKGGSTMKLNIDDALNVFTVGQSLTDNDVAIDGADGIPLGVTNDIAGTCGVVKTGAGTLVLSATDNSYTGTTTVSAGTLSVTGSLGATAVSVAAGTLSGNGNFGGDVTIAATGTHRLAVAATAGGQDTSVITGTLTLAAGNTLDLTAASPPAAGEYVLATAPTISGTPTTITGTPAGGTVTVDTASTPDRLLLTIAAASGYATWKGANAGGQDPDLDFDNDGVDNGVEYFMDAIAGFTASPVLDGTNTITWPNGGNILPSAYDTEYVIQTSSDLSNWLNVDVGDLTTNSAGPGGSLTYTLTGAAPRFVRLKVTPN